MEDRRLGGWQAGGRKRKAIKTNIHKMVPPGFKVSIMKMAAARDQEEGNNGVEKIGGKLSRTIIKEV
jgi:hypothetical protein